MKEDKSYSIIAGPTRRPETVDRGVLEKGLGQGTTNGAIIQTLLSRSSIGVPNWTEAWGVRLDKDGKVPDKMLDVRDPLYRGQIKEMEWGKEGGYMIQCRYLKGYNSIDQLYQDVVLNAKDYVANTQDTEASANVFMLFLQSGDNFFDPETDPYLVQMLKIHYMNESSKSTNPDYQNYMFREKVFGQGDEKVTKTFNQKFEALKIVNEAAQDNTLTKLKNLYAIMDGVAEMDVKVENLFTSLSGLADTQSDVFLTRIIENKKNISTIFEKLKSFEAIDLTKDGIIVAGVDKKEVIASEVPGKKEGMLDWVLENYLDDKSANIVLKLKTISEKIK